jgi:hypothetical protein
MRPRTDIVTRLARRALLVLAGLALASACGGTAPQGERVANTHSALGIFDSGSRPTIIARGGGQLEVFAIGAGRVQQLSYSNPGGWSVLWNFLPPPLNGTNFVGQPAAVSWDATRIDVFAVDDQGFIEHNWSDNYNSVWSPTWEEVPNQRSGPLGHYCSPTGMTVSSWGANRLDLFVHCHYPLSKDDPVLTEIWQITYDNGWNTPPQNILSQLASSPTSLSAVSWGPNRIDLVMEGWSYFNSTQSSPSTAHFWTNDGGVNWLGAEDLSGPAVVPGGGDHDFNNCHVSLSSWGPNVLDVITDGSINAPLSQKSYRAGWGSWVDWSLPLLTNVDNEPLYASPDCSDNHSSASWGPGRIDLVYPGVYSGDGLSMIVMHAWYNESDPKGWWGPEPL